MKPEAVSYVVCDARSMQVFAPDPPFTLEGVLALDLPQDLWRDFVFFIEETGKAERQGNAELRYRYLRASLLSLFAHLNAFFDMLIASKKTDTAYKQFKEKEMRKHQNSPDWPNCEQGKFVILFSEFVQHTHNIKLPAVDWSVKPLRNLLAHPNGVRDITVADLYQLDAEKLLTAALSLQAWIVEATKLCSIDYEIDTLQLASKLLSEINAQVGHPHQLSQSQRF